VFLLNYVFNYRVSKLVGIIFTNHALIEKKLEKANGTDYVFGGERSYAPNQNCFQEAIL
jgi:hypothetical protein